jgi:hypothetical protein
MTQRRARLLRLVRSLPVPLLTAGALWLGKPWLIVFALGWGFVDVVRRRQHEKALDTRLHALVSSLRGDVEADLVVRGLEAFVADATAFPGYHSAALIYLGVARARSGDVDGALSLLHTVQGSGWLVGHTRWRNLLLSALAVLHAARGDLVDAQRWRDVRHGGRSSQRKGYFNAGLLIALKSGRYDEAIARTEPLCARKPELAARSGIALLHAFARDQAGRPLPDAEARSVVAAWLARAGRIPFEKWWPELGAFAERHGKE